MKLRTLPLVAAIACLPQCRFNQADAGDLCIYTARSVKQVQRELGSFAEAHPDIHLHCPSITTNDAIVCPDGSGDACDRSTAKWEVFRQSTGTLTATIEQEYMDGRLAADVIWGLAISHVLYLDFENEHDIFTRYKPEHTDKVQHALDERLRKVDANLRVDNFWTWFLDPTYVAGTQTEPLWVGVDAFSATLCINTDKLAQRYTDANIDPVEAASLTWEDLPNIPHDALGEQNSSDNPKLSGPLAAPQPTASGAGFAQFIGLLGVGSAACPDGGADCVNWNIIRALDEHIAIYTSSGDLPCQLAAQKESPIVVGITHDGADLLPHTGDNRDSDLYDDIDTVIRRIVPNPNGTGFDVAVSVLPRTPRMEPTAQTFLDWASSPEAMEKYALSTPLTAYLPENIPSPRGYPPDFEETFGSFRFDFVELASRMDDYKRGWCNEYCTKESPISDELRDSLAELLNAGQISLEPKQFAALSRCASYCGDQGDTP